MSMEEKIENIVSEIRADVCKAHNADHEAHIRTMKAYIELKGLCDELESSGLIIMNDPMEEWSSAACHASNDAIADIYDSHEINTEDMEGEDEITMELVQLSNIITTAFVYGAAWGSDNPKPKK